MRRQSALLGILLAALLIAGGTTTSFAARPDDPPGNTLRFDKGKGRPIELTVEYPSSWSEEAQIFFNSRKLVNVSASERGARKPTARIKIYAEPRRDHADALEQIRQFAAGVGAEAKDFLSLGGWPALQTIYVETRPQPDRGPRFEDPEVLRVATLIAAGDVLVHIHASLPSRAKGRLIQEAKTIARSVAFEAAGEPEQVERELELLRQGLAGTDRALASDPLPAAFVDALRATAPPADASPLPAEPDPGYNQRVFFGGFGEIEIAASPDGQNVVIGKNIGVWVASNDGGETFPNGGNVPAFNCGDPSMAWGQSGAFYYAGIDCGCTAASYTTFPAPGAGPFGYDCNGLARSTDNGVSFPLTGAPMVICEQPDPDGVVPVAGSCFPDQEHIAADRFNPGSGGGSNDQVYSTWRNFDTADQDAAIVCTEDSGATWTTPFDLGPNSFFPRIATGGDGFVYVAAIGAGNYRLWKFNSCANGLGIVPGFPVNVAATPGDLCPFAGHDRCDQNPISQTVVVDDVNPNHLYFAYSRTTGANNDDILVHHSLDGGASWSGPVQANAAFPGERVMPWLCATGGDALVTWFDRRNAPVCATPPCPGINNDRTDFYGAKVTVDFGGNLQAAGDFVISEAPDNWCGSGWPCGTRDASYSESCSVQPQLAGTCFDTQGNADGDDDVNLGERCDFSDCGGANTDIVFPNATCQCVTNDQTNIQCRTGGGCPKYGDYNGNACAAGRLFAGWPSASSPPGVPLPSSNIGLLFDSLLVGEVPHLQVPGPLEFGSVCDGGSATETLNVCNTGTATLEIQPITSDDPQFEVTAPSGGYPVRISPDFCFPFQVEFTPTADGEQNATLTIRSDDPTNPVQEVEATASAGEAEIVTTIQPAGNFGLVCLGDQKDLDLTIHNAGGCDLSVTSITSSDPEFVVGSVDGYPLVVAAGDSVLVPVRFEPTDGFGIEGATFTVFSNDPDDPSHEVAASGEVQPGDINVPAATSPVAFGNVCADDTATVDIPVCNTGVCNLNVASASIDCDDFTIVANPFPTAVSPDFCIPLTVAYTPSEAGTHQCTLTILSDDPDESPVNVTLSATTPAAIIDVPPDQAFGAEVVQSVDACSTSRLFPVSNNGLCPLTITDVAITTNDAEYSLDGLPSFPIPVQSGHLLGAGDLSLTFAPDEPLDRDKLGEVSVTYVSDAVTGDTTTVVRNLCGEGVLTGARVLVTYGGAPVDEVERLQIQRITANRNRRPQLDTVDVQQRLPLVTVTPDAPCPSFQYHGEFGTVANPIQLLPGVYQVNATIRVDGRRYTKSVGFSVQACDFNPTVVVTF